MAVRAPKPRPNDLFVYDRNGKRIGRQAEDGFYYDNSGARKSIPKGSWDSYGTPLGPTRNRPPWRPATTPTDNSGGNGGSGNGGGSGGSGGGGNGGGGGSGGGNLDNGGRVQQLPIQSIDAGQIAAATPPTDPTANDGGITADLRNLEGLATTGVTNDFNLSANRLRERLDSMGAANADVATTRNLSRGFGNSGAQDRDIYQTQYNTQNAYGQGLNELSNMFETQRLNGLGLAKDAIGVRNTNLQQSRQRDWEAAQNQANRYLQNNLGQIAGGNNDLASAIRALLAGGGGTGSGGGSSQAQ